MYPFLFHKDGGKYFVYICQFDFGTYNTRWMGDKDLGDVCWVPDPDIVKEKHVFTEETDALRFIRNWWILHEIS